MKIFISSLITGMEDLRAAAVAGVKTLGHEPITAENFGARPQSPQIACLDGVRQATAIVLILGARYGAKQASGLSATHEEFREARDRCPVLVFVQAGVTPEPDEARFIQEVEDWKDGYLRDGFINPSDLQTKVTHALHQLALAAATAPLNAEDLLRRAVGMIPSDTGRYSHELAALYIAIAVGPSQTIMRPSKMDDAVFVETLEREALYGTARIFQRGAGTVSNVIDGDLVIAQDVRNACSLTIDPEGGCVFRQPLEGERDRTHGVIIVETVQDRLTAVLRYAAWMLDHLDPSQRLTHFVVAAQIIGGMTMRTRLEHDASPNSYQISGYGAERPPVHLTPAHKPRPALTHQADQVVEDLVVLLRRQWR